jgi:uncharacterized iron-regulated membrane protein
MSISSTAVDMVAKSPSTALYRAVWRWHFYAGLFVIPFLIMLAVTGAFMMVYSDAGNELGWASNVTATGKTLPVSIQARAALAAVPEGKLATYIAPRAADRPAYFEISKADAYFAVAINPYNAAVLSAQDEAKTYRTLAEKIHGSLLIGTIGDRLIEIAASLAIILVATGLYMWWPRNQGFANTLVPQLSTPGRGLWKELHKTTGVWISLILVLFMLSGLSWTGIWGDTWVKPWSTFPSNKWDSVPLSDLTHASLNHDILHEVPWGLEQTLLPASGSNAGIAAVAQPVVLDTVAQWAAANGFANQFKLSVPADEKGVFTVSYDGRNQDSANPSHDRFVHIDQYTGNILADVRFADYTLGGKVMAWGIALHKGMVGRVNFVFNLVYLALVLLLCVSGFVMWWKRRPAGSLAAPLYPRDYKLTAGVAAIAVVLGAAFPLGGLAIAAFAIIDFFLPKRLKQAGFQNS